MAEISSPKGSKAPWIIAGAIILLMFPIGIVFTYTLAAKNGVEFSPDDFSSRHFSYSRIEWLDLTLSGISYDSATNPLQSSLITDGWIKSNITTTRTWHLVSDSVTTGESPDFDAKILMDYLRMPFWEEWNLEKSNQPKAKVLWPAVATLARNYAYWAIPDLMDLAINQTELTNDEFVARIKELSSSSLLKNGKMHIENGEWEQAEKSLTDALEIEESVELYESRAKVYDQLEKPDLAASDRKSANDLGTK